MVFTAKQLADFLKGEVIGNPDTEVDNFARIEEGKPRTITFLANPKYNQYIYTTKADIVLVNNDFIAEKEISATLIKVPNAYEALGALLEMVGNLTPIKTGIEELSQISQSANIGEEVYVGSFAYISDNAEIGDGSKIYPHVYIGDNVKIGKNTTIYSGAKIYHNCKIGDNCIIHSGAVIGADGFGFNQDNEGVYKKIQHMGNVIIQDEVEVGANTTIDRAVMGSTIISKGVKLDNLIMIAHNSEIGKNTAMAAQVGVAGSTKIGENCVLAGQVGIGGHISIGDRTQVGAQAGIISNTPADSKLMGSPAFNIKSYLRSTIIQPKLPDMYRQISALERELNEIKKLLEEE